MTCVHLFFERTFTAFRRWSRLAALGRAFDRLDQLRGASRLRSGWTRWSEYVVSCQTTMRARDAASRRMVSWCNRWRVRLAVGLWRTRAHWAARRQRLRTRRHRRQMQERFTAWVQTCAQRNYDLARLASAVWVAIRTGRRSAWKRWVKFVLHSKTGHLESGFALAVKHHRESLAGHCERLFAHMKARQKRSVLRVQFARWRMYHAKRKNAVQFVASRLEAHGWELLRGALSEWRFSALQAACLELERKRAKDHREIVRLRTLVSESESQKQQVAEQLNYSMHVLEYVMANQ
jgi:hypothetical protein